MNEDEKYSEEFIKGFDFAVQVILAAIDNTEADLTTKDLIVAAVEEELENMKSDR